MSFEPEPAILSINYNMVVQNQGVAMQMVLLLFFKVLA